MSKNTGGLIKKGDVIWVRYRHDPLWPALVQNVYPKKVTYLFFPLVDLQPGKKMTPFSCHPKTVFRVCVSEKLPVDATEKLKDAIQAAKLYLIKEGREEGSAAPLREDSVFKADDDDDIAEVSMPPTSKDSNADDDAENYGALPDEEKPSGSDQGDEDFEEIDGDYVEEYIPPPLKRARFSPPHMRTGDSSSLEDPETGEDEAAQSGGELPDILDGFIPVIDANYMSILENLYAEHAVRTYSVPKRCDMRMSLTGSKFLCDDNVDVLFGRILDFVNNHEDDCRVLPAVHLVSEILFPEVITRCLMIYKNIDYAVAKLAVYSTENGTNSSVDSDKWKVDFRKVDHNRMLPPLANRQWLLNVLKAGPSSFSSGPTPMAAGHSSPSSATTRKTRGRPSSFELPSIL